jgi:hypothetical protein
MESIRVDVDGLSALGAVCRREAEALSVDRPVPQAGRSFQATTMAVDGLVRTAGRAENLISMRLRVTGHTILIAADRLANCENTSREQIVGVGSGMAAI